MSTRSSRGSSGPDAARSAAFPPVWRADARVLILGSLPGARSLAEGRYYAHPQNGFWRLIGGVLGVDLAALEYEARLERLLARRVAVSDVMASAVRRGSLDAAIRDAEAADLGALADLMPGLRAVAFNGALAAKAGRARLAGRRGLDLVDLPSSSPAYAAMRFEEKLARWSALRAYLA